MSISSWQPESDLTTVKIETQELDEFVALGHSDVVEKSTKQLTQEQIEKLQIYIKQSRAFWMQQAENISTEKLHNLIRFFTLAEENNSDLYCGNDSPVIAFNKVLKKRSEALDKDFLQWIKSHSTNRFLPNGSIL